jgi:ATP phosphoribosyltransferase
MTAIFPTTALVPELDRPVILAVPKGRILKSCAPLLARLGIEPEADFSNEDSRKLRFVTSDPKLDIVRVRSFDVATFVAHGAAHLGICGSDVVEEFDYDQVYVPVDLGFGRCRISVAEPAETAFTEDYARWSEVRVATKYPNLTRKYFEKLGVQVRVVHLSGAMEIAPSLGIARIIVDLVETGSTLRANGLVETEVITEVTSRLIVNRPISKTHPELIWGWVNRFRAVIEGT